MFEKYFKMLSGKTNKIIGSLLKLQNLLPRAALMKIYKYE